MPNFLTLEPRFIASAVIHVARAGTINQNIGGYTTEKRLSI